MTSSNLPMKKYLANMALKHKIYDLKSNEWKASYLIHSGETIYQAEIA